MLRPATVADFSFVYDLYFLPENNPYLLYEPMSKDAFEPIFAAQLNEGVKYIFEINGHAVGMVKISGYTHRMAHIAYIGAVAIHPKYAGHGLGLQLMHDTIHFCKSLGYTRLELDVDDDNPKAKRLYEKAGFETEGLLRNYSNRAAAGQLVHNYRMGILL